MAFTQRQICSDSSTSMAAASPKSRSWLAAVVASLMHVSATLSGAGAQPPPMLCRAAMNGYCNGPLADCRADIVAQSGTLPLYALHDLEATRRDRAWRCYSYVTLVRDAPHSPTVQWHDTRMPSTTHAHAHARTHTHATHLKHAQSISRTRT